MSDWAGARVLIAGAGALGLCAAVELARAGARVTVADGAEDPNASAVAAGMLAPVGEAILDPQAGAHLHLLLRARDLWPAFAAGIGAPIHRSGVLLFGREEMLEKAQVRLRDAAVAPARLLSSQEAACLSPGLAAPGPALFTTEDWRIDPAPMLTALRRALADAGGCMVASHVAAPDGDGARLASGETIAADRVVLATGLAPSGMGAGLAELSALRPIKGQLIRYRDAGPVEGPIVRSAAGYVVPGPDGACVGATMEPGLLDRRVCGEAVETLRRVGEGLFPTLRGRAAVGAAGVRSATPDGLPLVGQSSRPGMLLALGARRNGWLLAPLVAQILRTGEGAEAGLFDPLRRFTPA